jgi:hypothetical protein
MNSKSKSEDIFKKQNLNEATEPKKPLSTNKNNIKTSESKPKLKTTQTTRTNHEHQNTTRQKN